jgi:1,4-dihydroxy-2-naphthoyl-CoA hydrolase
MKDNKSIWYRSYTIEELNVMGTGTIAEVLGLRFIEIGIDYLKAVLPVDKRTIQPFGLLHGGSSVVLAETMGSVASLMCINDSLFMGVGLEVNANHLKGVRHGNVTGICTPVKIGGKVHVWEIKLYDEAGDNICVSRLTTMIIPQKK